MNILLVFPALIIFNLSLETGKLEYALAASLWFLFSMGLVELAIGRNIKLAFKAHMCGALGLLFLSLGQINSAWYLILCLPLFLSAGYLYNRSWAEQRV
jgi:hypothetical protein